MATDTRTSHTPGPLISESTEDARRDGAQLPDDCSFWIAGDNGVGEVTALVIETSQKEAEGNARLIAAAPELLAFAVEAENWLDNHGGADNDPGARMLLDMCRAAIAKAEGRA